MGEVDRRIKTRSSRVEKIQRSPAPSCAAAGDDVRKGGARGRVRRERRNSYSESEELFNPGRIPLSQIVGGRWIM